MNLKLLLPFLVFTPILSAQTFTEVPLYTRIDGVGQGAVTFADVDGDLAPDVLVTGRNISAEAITKLYINDGAGNYMQKINTPFEQVYRSAQAFADVDGDLDLDVLITGRNSSGVFIAKLYINDGAGSFSEITGTPFEGVNYSSVAFSDVDGDLDQDVLISGENNTGTYVTKLYINDAIGHFTEKTDELLEGAARGNIAFADVDGDLDQDVLITGDFFFPIPKLYLNDGEGHFTKMPDTPFEALASGAVAFADIDGDADQDVLLTGYKSMVGPQTKLYTNDGNGTYTEVLDTYFQGTHTSSIAFVDVDSDLDQDFFISGDGNIGQPIIKLFINDGAGHYSEKVDALFEGISSGSIVVADVDGDLDFDLLVSGKNDYSLGFSQLYTNDGAGNYSEKRDAYLVGVVSSEMAYADVDGDLDLDVLLAGRNNAGTPITRLYRNDGLGQFAEKTDAIFEGVDIGSIAFADIDGDVDPDILITGRSGSNNRITKLYTNDGSGNYTEMPTQPIPPFDHSSAAFADVDGDLDQDVLIIGRRDTGGKASKLYISDGHGHFTEKPGTPFDGVEDGALAFADIDGDLDLDVIISGDNNLLDPSTKLYVNDGLGNFTERTDVPFRDVDYSAIAFADVDGDQDQDVIISGRLNNNIGHMTKLYINDSFGHFTEKPGVPFDQISHGAIVFADIDGDQDQDVLIAGNNSSNTHFTKLYINNGIGNFTEAPSTAFDGVELCDISVADFDADLDADVLISGRNNSITGITKLYLNNGFTSPTLTPATKPNLEFTTFPNPVAADELCIRYNSPESGIVTLKLFDLHGRLFMQQQTPVNLGEQTITWPIAPPAAGVYFMELTHGERKGVVKVVVR